MTCDLNGKSSELYDYLQLYKLKMRELNEMNSFDQVRRSRELLK